MSVDSNERGELVLAPGEYIYIQDKQNGRVKTHVGGKQLSLSSTDIPVVWDYHQKKYIRHLGNAQTAVQRVLVVPEGFYLVLLNPSKDGSKPKEEGDSQTPELEIGKKIIIAGPDQRVLWPGQYGEIIRGHRLCSNEFLVVEIYNDEEATRNWSQVVIKEAAPDTSNDDPSAESIKVDKSVAPPIITLGQRIVIKGTSASFYMPATGMKVIPGEDKDYVQKAVTLERLEYCILVGEDGNKRYVKGPDVVFPQPTERFVRVKGVRKFRAIELNPNTAIHIKVIEDYMDGDKNHPAGEEMFIRGDETPIYYPRKEHSVIRYGDEEELHFAVAIPEGEARYVLDKDTGEVSTAAGPKMLLADPRHEVIVQRVLTKEQTELWYPGNESALAFNTKMAELREETGTEYLSKDSRGNMDTSRMVSRSMYAAAMTPREEFFESDVDAESNYAGRGFAGDSHTRKAKFTPPRTVKLDTKFDGVPDVSPWVGYAVMKTKKDGTREVVLGPKTALMKYDEVLQVLSLSTGKPKTTDQLHRTVYLRVKHNKISDIITVETNDKIPVKIKLSYRVNFIGETQEEMMKWFDVENYVKFLCDHVRSRLRRLAKDYSIEEFSNSVYDLVRNCILGEHKDGEDRTGLLFEENKMHLYDVEILGVIIDDEEVDSLLSRTRLQVVKDTLQIQSREMEIARVICEEEAARSIADQRMKTRQAQAELDRSMAEQLQAIAMEKYEAQKAQAGAKSELLKIEELDNDLRASSLLARNQATIDQKISEFEKRSGLEIAAEKAKSANVVAEVGAVSKNLAASLERLGDDLALKSVAEAMAPMAYLGGSSVAEVIQKILGGTPLESIAKALTGKIVNKKMV